MGFRRSSHRTLQGSPLLQTFLLQVFHLDIRSLGRWVVQLFGLDNQVRLLMQGRQRCQVDLSW